MAIPVPFTPKPLDPREGLRKRLDAAPMEHAEALLVGYDLIQAAHDEGILDLLHGMVKHKDVVFEHLSAGAAKQESIDAMRNLISMGKMLTAIEPETMSCIAAALSTASKPRPEEPASLWQLFKRVGSREGRRGLTLMVELLVALGTRRFADSALLNPAKSLAKR
ncbi:helical membrane plugin domain-containing protein [Terriglobus aquaticus]|uniref:DUF1641 domain-containing protein n=1 Tax=Terriglobus aquaticus TaxID=940139 RepID=A0ABW9KI71_9BACT|nr:DUF1641 domain-containing protein [Terriglobus aquaticus]